MAVVGVGGSPAGPAAPSVGEPPCSRAIPLTQPCRGLLVPPEQARQGLSCVDVELPRCSRLRKAEADRCTIRKLALLAKLSIQRNKAAEMAALLQESTEDASPGNVAFWRIASGVAGGLLALAGILGVVVVERGKDRAEFSAAFLVVGASGLILGGLAIAGP